MAVPFFSVSECHPTRAAYLPWSRINPSGREDEAKWEFTCFPAGVRGGAMYAREEYDKFFDKFFDAAGIEVLRLEA